MELVEGQNQLAWYDGAGRELGKVGPPGRFLGFALSPDQKTVALSQPGRSGTSDI